MKIKYVVLLVCCFMNCYAKLASQTSVNQQIVIPDSAPYIFVDFQGHWLKVKIKINGKYHIGWLSPDQQCANVYSTCS